MTILAMAHMANMVMGIAFGTAATVFKNQSISTHKGFYCYVDYDDLNKDNKPYKFPPDNDRNKKVSTNSDYGWFYRVSASDFKKIPGSPIAYWVSDSVINVFENHRQIYNISISEGQNITANNDKYLRFCWEVNRITVEPAGKWSFYSKGGSYRKWFGNLDYVVDWSDEARKHYHKHSSARIIPKYLRFREGVTWTLITSSRQSFRYLPDYATFDKGGSSIFFDDVINLRKALLFLNTKISAYLTKLYNATLNLQVDDVRKLPLSPELIKIDKYIYSDLVANAKKDWDFYETSWNFTSLPLLEVKSGEAEGVKWGVEKEVAKLSTPHFTPFAKLSEAYTKLRTRWQQMTLEMQRLEEENNRIFIEAYGLQDELTPEVPLKEITLTCNPHYRYGGDKTEAELEALLLADTMREFISYAVGCMFGRYALDKPGLILANQGETIEDYRRIVGEYLVMSNERGKDEGQQLSGSDRVAEGDGCGRDDLSGNQAVSQGRDLRADESDSQSSSLDSVKHSRGAGTQVNTGLQTVSANLSGIESRSGNTTDSRSASELSNARTTDANSESAGRNLQNDQQPESKTPITHDSLLDTHYSFLPDEDNVIPMLDGDWFPDDIAERFRKFLRVTFGEEHYEENLKFLETAIGKDIRKYFLRDFYTDHLKRYKKRPIYWLFSSPKGTFNALIYMHRYRPDTVSVVLNDYLREFRTKLTAHKAQLEHISISTAATAAAKTKALKDIEALNKNLQELDDYERDVLYPLATEQIDIDLDDGVKANYPKFGKALKPIPGLT